MSPREAIQNPVALFYGAAVFTLLLVAGLGLLVFRRRGWPLDHAGQAYRGWLIIVPVTATAVLLGRVTTVLFFTAVSLLGFREFARATGLDDRALATGVGLGILLAGATALIPPRAARADGYSLFLALPAVVVPGLLAVPVLRDHVGGQVRVLSLAVLGYVLFGWLFGHVAFLANGEHPYAYLAYLLFAVEVTDVAAYLSGKAFGRRLLRPTVSPNKTWEGAAGGLAVALALPWAVWFTFPHLHPIDLLAVGLIVGVAGPLGDLAVSVLKRDLGLKDMGAILPGHGGILDRIDSLLCAAPLFVLYLRYRHGAAPP